VAGARRTVALGGRLGEEDDRRGPHVSEGGEGKARWASRRPLGRLAGGSMRGRGRMGRGWAERPDGPAGRWADWAESEGKFFSE
jgi:hypothetical protein